MTDGIRNICTIDVIGEWFDKIDEKIAQAISLSTGGVISVELTEYANYCLNLLQSNGCDIVRDADEIQHFIWNTCPYASLTFHGYPNSLGSFRVTDTAAYFDIILRQ